MPSLNLHLIGGIKKKVKSAKATKRQKKKWFLERVADKLEFTRHAEEKIVERNVDKGKINIKKNLINAILGGRIKHNKKYKCYKIYGDFGIYILGENLKIVTIMTEKRPSVLDPYYEPLTYYERRALLETIGFQTENKKKILDSIVEKDV